MNEIILDIENNIDIIQKITMSDTKSDVKKIVVRSVEIKGRPAYQIERYKGNQVFHENTDLNGIKSLPIDDYRQILIEKIGTSTIYSKAKFSYKVKTIANNINNVNRSHNKEKMYILNEGENILSAMLSARD